jgi:hypothetical protein
MTEDGAVLDFCGSFPNGDGIYDLNARVFKDTSVLRPAYAALGSQVPQQLFLQHSACLDEQAAVNRFVGHAQALVIGIPDLQPSRNLSTWRVKGGSAQKRGLTGIGWLGKAVVTSALVNVTLTRVRRDAIRDACAKQQAKFLLYLCEVSTWRMLHFGAVCCHYAALVIRSVASDPGPISSDSSDGPLLLRKQ